MIPPGRPPPLYHTPSLLPFVITTLFESWPVQKPLQVWFFFGLALLWHAWEGQGKEMGGPAALRSPRAGLGEASPVFFDSAWACKGAWTHLVLINPPCGFATGIAWPVWGRNHQYSHFCKTMAESSRAVQVISLPVAKHLWTLWKKEVHTNQTSQKVYMAWGRVGMYWGPPWKYAFLPIVGSVSLFFASWHLVIYQCLRGHGQTNTNFS